MSVLYKLAKGHGPQTNLRRRRRKVPHGVKGWIVMKNEMSRRQFLGFAGSAAAVLGLGLVGCGGSAGSGSSASGDAAEVYFLNFKPEVDKEWKEIAKAY